MGIAKHMHMQQNKVHSAARKNAVFSINKL